MKGSTWIGRGVFLGIIFLAACGKKNDGGGTGPGGGPGGGTGGASGAIYVQWATSGIQKIDVASGVESTVMPENTDLHDYYISQDGKNMLTSMNAPGTDYDANLYTLSTLSNNTIISQFKYYPTDGDYTSPTLSPDGTMIGVLPTYDDGIVIMDLHGNILHRITSFNNQKLASSLNWMPDGTILFTTSQGLYHANAAYTQATLIKQFTFANWGDIAVSTDGAKIALSGGNHIWMMNADGTGLTQVTTSTQVETYPVFSPDGKYLLVGTNYRESLSASWLWNLAIIPADGEQYNVDPGADQHVIQVIPKGQTNIQAGDGSMFWR